MTVYDDGMTQLWHSDSRALPIPDESVDMIMTSPPYYSARKYGGGADMVWDAAEGCEHVWGFEYIQKRGNAGYGSSTLVGTQTAMLSKSAGTQGQFCQRCGAWRGQLGLEPSLELYIAHLMQIFDECWRVLKGGVMVVNLGDSYAGSGGAGGDYNPGGLKDGQPKYPGANATGKLKPLDLCMVPSRVALALQERGWYLRSAIPWIKRASMPSSERGDRWERCRVKVAKGKLPAWRDRSEGHHEATGKDGVVGSGKYPELSPKYVDCPGCPKCLPNDGLVLRKGNWRPGKSLESLFVLSKTGDYYSDAEGVRILQMIESGGRYIYAPAGRNRREADWCYESLDDLIAHHEREARRLKHLRDNGGLVWEDGEPLAMLLNPKGYKEAHFATYPPSLCEPFIKAYTSDKGNCPECGKPWVRIMSHHYSKHRPSGSTEGRKERGLRIQDDGFGGWGSFGTNLRRHNQTLGWRPTCTCEAEPVPATVLDPFAGACSTAIAAGSLGRKSIMIECCEEYLDMAVKRLGGGYSVKVDGAQVEQTHLFGQADT